QGRLHLGRQALRGGRGGPESEGKTGAWHPAGHRRDYGVGEASIMAGCPWKLRVKLLAFDTSTETMSVAVLGADGTAVLASEGPGGAQASAGLIPAIERLLAQAGVPL